MFSAWILSLNTFDLSHKSDISDFLFIGAYIVSNVPIGLLRGLLKFVQVEIGILYFLLLINRN